ncbi:MAG: substrate-binding domain-containing protein, partial [Ruminiclostridium sp.]|nr:substrate-binding domain-containing protein [Ruminiclostridium sp.]
MKDKKKIIGVCLTRAEDDFRTSFLTHFQNCAIENNFKLIVFNSPSDFINKSINDNCSKKIYDLINYDVMDAFVILCETIYDHSLTCQLTEKAHSCNIPVILIHEQAKGCFCVVRKYTEEFKTMLRHLFSVHGIKKPVFIGGYKENDPQTQIRLECFRDVLSEFGTEYSSDMVFYGKYYEAPTTEIIQKILDSDTGIPDAFICANDMMAMAACNTLAANGYRVPEDIKVSGFDGIENAEYFIPGITTCKEDIRALAAQTADIINNALDGTMTPGTFYEHYLPVFRGSCGCRNDTETDYGKIVKLLFDRHFDSRQHEMHIYRWANSALYSEGINSLSSALKDLLLVDSSVFLYNDFIMTLFGTAPEGSSAYPHKEFTVIASHPHDLYAGRNGRFPAYDMMPDFGKWLENTSMCVLTPIIVGDGSCGVYCVYTDTPGEIADKMFRIAQNINIVFGALVSRIIKRNIQSSMMNAMYTDIPTGLPNLKGITKWFNEFSSNDSNHRLAIAVGVYSIPQYKYIFENYGTDEIEQAVKYTADALKIAYSDNKFIARTANDEFTVFSYSDFEDELNETVENSFSVFSGIIDAYNTNNDKKYFLEINYGRTIANAGWNGNLRTFIKLAGSEMYINKLKSGLIPVLKEDRASQDSAIKSPKELYTEFTLLVEKNLFTYFFQPIVYAKTGEIYAYEALMRTKGGINMSPLRILDIAKEYNMLYDIEKATMFNVMERYDLDRELFGNALIFINTIPGSFLNKHDISKL